MVRQSTGSCLSLIVVLAAGLAGGAAAGEGNQEIINMVIDALKSNDPQMQSGAIAIVREIPGPEVTKALVQELPKLPSAGQVQLLSALADRGDATALPAVIEAGKSQDEAVRVAALRAVGQLGTAANVPLLAERAAASRGVEQKAAREGLYRLRGPEVDAAILQNITSAASNVKVELIGAVGERNISGALEALLKTGKDQDRRVRLESFKVLRIVAKPQDLPALVNLLLEVEGDMDRGEAEKMIAAVAHKIEDKSRQAVAVLAVLPNVKDVPDRASLLRVLGRIGDGSALPTLRTALTSRDAEIRDAAIRALSDWPTNEPVPDLLKVARTAESRVHKVLALRGFVRLLGLESDRSPEETIDLYKKAMDLAGDATEKKGVLSGLGGTKSPAALDMVAGYLGDLALYLEAESGVVRIAQGIYGAYPQRVKEVLQKMIQGTKNDTVRQQAQQVIAAIERLEDYITAWQVSGPYAKENVDGAGLFDVPFAPEQEGQNAKWRIAPVGTDPNQPWLIELDKDAALAGDNRVAYLRTRITSPKEQKAQLELGSDDGVKVWLNGQVVHTVNATRGVMPGQDKVPVTLKEAENVLLVKLTQNSGQWALSARLRRPDGNKLDGLKFEP